MQRHRTGPLRRHPNRLARSCRPIGPALALALVGGVALAHGHMPGSDGGGQAAELFRPATIGAAIGVLGLGWISLQVRRLHLIRAAQRRAQADR